MKTCTPRTCWIVCTIGNKRDPFETAWATEEEAVRASAGSGRQVVPYILRDDYDDGKRANEERIANANEELEREVLQLRYDYAELRTHVERYFVALTALSSLQEVKRAKDAERDAIATHLDRVNP